MFLKKPRSVCLAEEKEGKLERNLSLIDLLAIGIGGTVGSGVFVLTGLIARDYAGPGVVWSWLISGFGCCFSAMSYAEMSCRIPSAGSSYAYVYHALGELPAVLAAWCLCLEYGVSGAAVARSWGEKVDKWTDIIGVPVWKPLDPGLGVNVFAAALQAVCVGLLLVGVEMGKLTVNFFTILKMLLVTFMIVAGLCLFKADNVSNWAPKGASGILRGATSAFFGYLGYDEVCCLAAEAKDPHVTLPRAVFGTICTVSVLYALASLALVGMMPYDEISRDSGFSDAFKDRDWYWAQHIVAAGEIVTLPLVVLISFLAQPRLQFAMAEDGLLPSIFSEVDKGGNLRKGIIFSGVVCTLIALFIPFTYLDDMISAGVLLSFNLTNSSLIAVRRVNLSNPGRCKSLLVAYNVLAFVGAMLLNYCDLGSPEVVAPGVVVFLVIYVAYSIATTCPEADDPWKDIQYRVPYMPFCPLFGIFVNYFLVAQLAWWGLLMIFGYFAIGITFYLIYGIHNSVGNKNGWVSLLKRSREHFFEENNGAMSSLEEQLIRKYLVSEDIVDDDHHYSTTHVDT